MRNFYALMALLVSMVLPGSGAEVESNLVPNGSFEFWTSVSDMILKDSKYGLQGDDPKAPTRWDFSRAVTSSADAHSGKLAVSAGGGIRLGMRFTELNPGSTYSYGVWVKGKGKLLVGINGQAFEGMQKLDEREGQGTNEWTEIRGQIKVPGHIRLAELFIQTLSKSELLIDDAFLSAKLEDKFNADDVLSRKYARDGQTLFFEDFDGAKPVISFPTKGGKSTITGDGGGRFGKGLRMFKDEMATLPFAVDKIPPEGTLECWISPDDFQKASYIGLGASDGNIFEIGHVPHIWWENKREKARGWLKPPYPQGSIGRRPGSWMHVAVVWDRSSIRMYIDGTLAILHTGDMPIWKIPVLINIGSWSGIMDEIRLSSVKRYGPFVPEGDKLTPFPDFKKVVAEAAVPESNATASAKSKPDPKEEAKRIARERGKLITPFKPRVDGQYEDNPNDTGEYIYEASSARPLVTEAFLDIQKDWPVKGMAVAKYRACRIIRSKPDIEGLYWKLGKIRSGKYWIAIQCNDEVNRLGAVFLNGRIIQSTRATDPVQVAPGIWIIEAQVDKPYDLKEGNEIAVRCQNGKAPFVVALFLRPQMPEPGRHPLPTCLGGDFREIYTANCIAAEAVFRGLDGKELPLDKSNDQQTDLPASFEKGADGRPVATVRISNPLPHPLKIDYSCEILSYYRSPVGGEKETIAIQPHQTLTRKVPFKIIPDEPAYSALVKIRAVAPPDLDWPEGDEISYFQGLRNSIAWPNPWSDCHLQRVVFTQPIKSPRQTIDLNGTWERAFTKSVDAIFPVPEGLTFKTTKLPGGLHGGRKDSKDEHGMYLRRKFTVPPEAAGRTYKIDVSFAVDEATIWVNGQKVGNVRGGNTPLSADATKAVKVGENEIVILVRDLVVLMNPDYVNKENPVATHLYLDVPGFFSSQGPSIGTVELVTSPLVSAEDVLALPSFRNKTLTARFSVCNRRDAPATFKVRTHVLDRDKSVLMLDEREMTLSSYRKEDVVIEKKWENPQLWGPGNPHLYVLAVEIFDSATGERIDFARERFGFRECWIDGPNIVLNGIPIRPKGIFGPKDFETVTMTRGTQGRTEWYDEMGRMGFQMTTMLCNSSSRHNVERDQFWEAAKSNAVVNIRTYGNHPSIVAWDISNEWLCFTDRYAPDPMLPGKRFKNVSDHLRAYDPTRWTLGNADGDFYGLLDNYSGHYLNPSGGDEAVLGHNLCLPDSQYWRPLDRHFTRGEEMPICYRNKNIFRPDQKVIMNNEHLWKNGWFMYPGMTEVCGEGSLLGMAIDSYSGPASWFWRVQVDGNRDMGVAPIQHFHQPGVDARASQPRSFLMPDVAHNGFSKKPFVRLFKIFNNEMSSAEMELKWELVNSAGKIVAKDNETVEMSPRQVHEGKIEFSLPDVDKRTSFVFRTRLYADRQFVTGQELDLDVWPDRPAAMGDLKRKICLYDSNGNTAKVFKDSHIEFEIIQECSAPSEPPEKTLMIIGENALDESSAAKCMTLAEFVHRGGRVVILGQTITPAGLPVATKLDPTHWTSLCFNRMPAHPVMEGVSDWDLSFWADDRIVGKGSYPKPERGTFITLIDSGYQKRGLEFVQMMELFRGKGSYILCQLPLIEKYNREPMAREMLSGILRYAENAKTFAEPINTLQAVIGEHGAIQKALEGTGVKYEKANLDSSLKENEPILVEADLMRTATELQKDKLANRLREGATIVISCPTPEDSAWLSKLAGTPAVITVQPYPSWHGRGMRNGFSRYTAGLSHQDLYWKRFDGGDSGRGQVDVPDYAFEAFQDFSAKTAGATELVYPGALLKLDVGKGILLIDERRWMTANADLAKHTARNLSALMLGLGVDIAPAIHIRQLSRELDYRTLDLTQFANRSLKDDKGQDGEGGWSDQGAGADLRSFKTGKLNFQGTPFLVGEDPRSCIVLRHHKRLFPEKYPTEVTIPVGYAVEGFYFLHGFAYCGGSKPVSTFRIIYEDGTDYDVKVIGDVNARDWIDGPSGFPHEKDTSSSVAWTGSSEMFPVVSVYKMLWVNPKPEIPVKAIRYFKTPEMGSVHIFMGLTSVLKRDSRKLSPEELAQVGDLMRKGAEAARKKDHEMAKTSFRRAMAIDPRNWDAYQQLGDILEQGNNEELLLEHYHLWVRNGATRPLPYNRIGELLEKKKDFRGALEFYTRSLQVEWNQPPVLEAKRRMEEALSK